MKIFSICMVLLLFPFSLTACLTDNKSASVNNNTKMECIWVFAQINIPEKENFEDYYYFGKIEKTLYDDIINQRKEKGLILFRDLHYFNDEDKVEKYEDDTYSGNVLFRIEHLVKVEKVKKHPLEIQTETPPAENSEPASN